MATSAVPILDRLSALSDPTRCRLLLVLERHELAVSELCAILQLPQSTVSRHLKVLGDEGWVVSRAAGTSRLYAMHDAELDPSARELWRIVRGQVAVSAKSSHDERRVPRVLAQRRERSREFFSASAREWDRLRAELYGEGIDAGVLLSLLDESWTVGDLGCGTGRMSEALAPNVARVIAVDDSAEMIAAAGARLGALPNVEIRRGDLAALPIDDAALDVAVLSLVLHYVVEPASALAEVARVVKPGGRLLVVDMLPHDRAEYQRTMGHVWSGFGESEVRDWLDAAGFTAVRHRALEPDPVAKGPALFVASARRSAKASTDSRARPDVRTPPRLDSR